MNEFFPIDNSLLAAADQAETDCAGAFRRIAETEEHNAQKVLRAFIDNRVSESLFGGSTGYGYDDRGRETSTGSGPDLRHGGCLGSPQLYERHPRHLDRPLGVLRPATRWSV
jgi:hypothetical protein